MGKMSFVIQNFVCYPGGYPVPYVSGLRHPQSFPVYNTDIKINAFVSVRAAIGATMQIYRGAENPVY